MPIPIAITIAQPDAGATPFSTTSLVSFSASTQTTLSSPSTAMYTPTPIPPNAAVSGGATISGSAPPRIPARL